MRLAINLILIALIGVLGYVLVYSIQEPIKFDTAKSKRLNAVTDRLKDIRTAQECYRGITGEFANSFDSLNYVLRNDSFLIVKIIGDKDDASGLTIKREENYVYAKDSMTSLGLLTKLDSLRFVPYSAGQLFELQADTLTYQKTLVNVVECRTQYSSFMGPYASEKYSKYDNTYNPDNYVKFGDMTGPNLSGNWE